MGTYAHAWIENRFQLEELAGLPALLQRACEGHDLRIWESGPHQANRWAFDEALGADALAEGLCLDGPEVVVHVTTATIGISTPLRWRGLLTIPPLRARCRALVHRLAGALSADRIIWIPDHADPQQPSALDELRARLTQDRGPAQPSLLEVSDQVVRECDRSPPSVWFEERVEPP